MPRVEDSIRVAALKKMTNALPPPRAETLAVMEQAQRASADRQATGPRAEFWKLRGLRGAKKNVRRTRDDLLQLTIQGKFPAYEKVLLREGLYLVWSAPREQTKEQMITFVSWIDSLLPNAHC